jgi:hypothetical protein
VEVLGVWAESSVEAPRPLLLDPLPDESWPDPECEPECDPSDVVVVDDVPEWLVEPLEPVELPEPVEPLPEPLLLPEPLDPLDPVEFPEPDEPVLEPPVLPEPLGPLDPVVLPELVEPAEPLGAA